MANNNKCIRHLEYYGFPDQNAFTKEGWSNPADGRQDHAIHELFKRTHMLKDWNIKQEKDIEKLTDEYNTVAETVVEHEGDIETISGNVSSISGTVGEIVEAIGGLPFPKIDEEIEELSGKVEDNRNEFLDYSATTAQYLKDYSEWVDLRYVHKDEIDGLIASGLSGYATEDWVKSQMYLTEASGNSIYLRQDSFSQYSAASQTSFENIEASARTLSNSIHVLDEKVNGYHVQVENYIGKTNALEDDVDALDARVGNNEVKIENINTALSGKVNTSTFENAVERLDGKIDNLSSSTDNKLDVLDTKKVDKANYDIYTANTNVKFDEVRGEIESLDSGKASVSSVTSLRDDLNAEISNRVSGDSSLQSQIDRINDTVIPGINDRINSANTRIADVNTRITQEVADRKAADLALIGSSDDAFTANTINGAKSEAVRQASLALSDSKDYTNTKVNELKNVDIANLKNDVEASLATKANISDLSALKESIESDYESADEELRQSFTNGIAVEAAARVLNDGILREAIQDNDNEIAALTTKTNGITSWDGTGIYEDTGSGVLDVLHREFHEFEENYGAIKDIKVVDGNLVITFYTRGGGTKEAVIPVTDIVDLSNYYTKEETDAKIAEAIAQIDLSNYYTKEETDAKIAEVNEKAEENKTNIASLFDKLGYTDNDTLATTNQHEVAFGEYNISNTGENDADKTIFSVGNGTSNENRQNAIEIRKDGTVYMWIEGEFMSINRLLGMLAHEIYD